MKVPDFVLRAAIPRVLGEENMKKLQAVYDWLTKVPGRKRQIGAAITALGILITGVSGALHAACAGDVLGGKLCTLQPDSWVYYLQAASDFVQQMPPDLTAVGFVVWAIGWAHALKRNKSEGAGLAAAAYHATVSADLPKPPAALQLVTPPPAVTPPAA